MLLPAEVIMGIVANPLVCAVALAAHQSVDALISCARRTGAASERLSSIYLRRKKNSKA